MTARFPVGIAFRCHPYKASESRHTQSYPQQIAPCVENLSGGLISRHDLFGDAWTR
jgi:hypothetical protein